MSEIQQGYKEVESGSRSLAYTEEFKELIAENRGVLTSIFKAIENGFEGESINIEGATVERYEPRREFYDKFFKVTVGDSS